MSRRWKKPNHSLPGWGAYKAAYHATAPERKSRRQMRRLKRGKKFRQGRSGLNVAGKPADQRFVAKPAPVEEWKPVVRESAGDLRRILRLEKGSEVLLSRWCRHQGKWFCTHSDLPIEWFTRCQNLLLIERWIFSNGYTKQWLTSQSSGSVDNNPDEEHPVDPSQGSAPQGDHTVPSKNNPSPLVESAGGLEQNGDYKSSLLNARG